MLHFGLPQRYLGFFQFVFWFTVLEVLKGSKKIVGTKQSIRAVESGSVKLVFVARDADEKVVTNLKELCTRNSVEVVFVENMKQLGKACGIEVGAAAVAVLK
jgi:large subunit ribosomal protein L7A